ncbi:hypothetical protein RIF29_38603 [Crotalaria pallida]|uniref:Transmembrane protein n=1 Tax=Crotalaria pallida TaxID=3830 RepID=A0AAN9E1G5_CROPI
MLINENCKESLFISASTRKLNLDLGNTFFFFIMLIPIHPVRGSKKIFVPLRASPFVCVVLLLSLFSSCFFFIRSLLSSFVRVVVVAETQIWIC